MGQARQAVVVTGSTSGIGQAVLLAFASAGADVVVHGRDQQRAEAVAAQARQQGGQAVLGYADLRQPAECAQIVTAAVDAYGRIDVLVNNAALVVNAATEQTPQTSLDDLLAVNVRSPYLLVQAALPHLRDSRGTIINITGSPAYRGAPRSSAFAAGKAALQSLTRSWAREFGPLGIRVNEISPGPTDTPLSRSVLALDDPEQRAAVAARFPTGRIGTPADIASAAVFLASEQASHINGATLAVDGGLLAS